jgi:sugar lactone lactonase YvrE
MALAPDGVIYTGCADGSIRRVKPDGAVDVWMNTGGRPLGMSFDSRGALIVCDAERGLLSISPQGGITVLTDRASGDSLGLPDDLDIARDGKIYFSDASRRFGIQDLLYEALEHRPSGRLLVYDPASRETRVLLKNLYFANGAALSRENDFVLVTETYAYRVRRYWLKGPRAGSSEIFIDNLPGFPDNISRGPGNNFWLALYTVRNDALDFMSPHPWIKKALSKLPRFLWPKPQPHALVLELDSDGRILQSLHDATGKRLKNITSAKQWRGSLYLGSLTGDRIGKLTLEKSN